MEGVSIGDEVLHKMDVAHMKGLIETWHILWDLHIYQAIGGKDDKPVLLDDLKGGVFTFTCSGSNGSHNNNI